MTLLREVKDPFRHQVKWFSLIVLKLVSSVCDAITLPVYLLIDRPWRVKLSSKVHHADRHYEANGDYYYWERREERKEAEKELLSEETKKLQDRLQKVIHLSELLTIVREVHRDKQCLGRRRVLGRKVENGGQLKFELSNEYEWSSYEQVLETIEHLADILYRKFQLKRGDRVALFAGTVPEYFLTFWSLQLLGCEVLLLRSTPNELGIPCILNENQIRLVFTQSDFVRVLNRLKPNLRTVGHVICFRSPYAGETDEQEVLNSKFDLLQYEQLLQERRTLSNPTNRLAHFQSTDIALVLATSGFTGQPKYVLISHANLVHSLAMHSVRTELGQSREQTFLAYLDAATILELRFEVEHFGFIFSIPFQCKNFLTI